MWNPNPGDDGWYVDDVRVTQTLGASVPTRLARHDRTTAPCRVAASICSSLTATLAATPASPRPRVGASSSRPADDGGPLRGRTLVLSQFWIDGNTNGVLGEIPQDTLVQDFSPNPVYQDAPLADVTYGVIVKCSSASSAPCSGVTAIRFIDVGCPGVQNTYLAEAWWAQLKFATKTQLTVPFANQTLDLHRGTLSTLRGTALGNFGGGSCLFNNTTAVSFTDATVPTLGDGLYYLIRGEDTNCNENQKYTTFSPKETPTAIDRRDDLVNGVTSCGP